MRLCSVRPCSTILNFDGEAQLRHDAVAEVFGLLGGQESSSFRNSITSLLSDCRYTLNTSSPAVFFPYSLLNSMLYFQSPFMLTSLFFIASAAFSPASMPATSAGPMPPALMGWASPCCLQHPCSR